MTNSLLASFHYIALALGFGGILFRGIFLRDLAGNSDKNPVSLKRLFLCDAFWGIAALLWLATGLIRVFGGFDKGTPYYMQNNMFWLKMALFLSVFLLELKPMMTFIKWRSALKKGPFNFDDAEIKRLRKINMAELHIVALIPFVASMMARGIGF